MTRRTLPRLLLGAAAVSLLSGCSGSPMFSDLFGPQQEEPRPVLVQQGPQTVFTPPPPPAAVEVVRPDPIPATPRVAAAPPAPGVPAVPPAPALRSAPTAPSAALTHRVAPGDTVYSLARRYGTTPAAIQAANGLGPDFAIKVDQALKIPSSETIAAMAGPGAAPIAKPAAAPTKPPRMPDLTDAPRKLMKPVDGSIVSEFGASTGTSTNDGIDFAADPGAIVKAAADGTVAFVSDDAGPLGSVVLIQHGGKLVTIYGRIAQASVRPGQTIAAGTPIARVAAPRTGGKALLHFELRRGSQPIDPASFF